MSKSTPTRTARLEADSTGRSVGPARTSQPQEHTVTSRTPPDSDNTLRRIGGRLIRVAHPQAEARPPVTARPIAKPQIVPSPVRETRETRSPRISSPISNRHRGSTEISLSLISARLTISATSRFPFLSTPLQLVHPSGTASPCSTTWIFQPRTGPATTPRLQSITPGTSSTRRRTHSPPPSRSRCVAIGEH